MRGALERQVGQGIAFLDQKAKHLPELKGWPDKIDLDRLDLKNAQDCVVGQLFEGFYVGCNALGITTTRQMQLYGFACRPSLELDRDYRSITQIWKRRIRALRKINARG